MGRASLPASRTYLLHATLSSTFMKTTVASQTNDSESLPEIQQDGAKLRRRFQIGLRDVAVWVVGSAVISYFARWWVARWRGDSLVYVYMNLSYIHPLLGLAVMILGMFIALRLARQVVGLARGSIDFGGIGLAMSPRVRAAAILWRLVAAFAVAAADGRGGRRSESAGVDGLPQPVDHAKESGLGRRLAPVWLGGDSSGLWLE